MKKIYFIALLIPLLLLFGCLNGENVQGTKNETKLEITQGIDVLKDKIVISELTPGGVGTISLTVRDNLGGVTAKDIIVGLDNLGLFKVVECGKDFAPYDKRSSECKGYFGYDPYLTVNQHGVAKMIPGQEINFWWRIKAPEASEIGYIALQHPLYYFLEYTYFTSSSQTVAFMSHQELVRRQQSNESTEISGKMKLSAGEITVNMISDQPIIYYYTYPNSENDEPPFDFTLLYEVKNVGDGFPMSDILIITELPKGISYTGGGWYKINDPNCKVTHVTYFENGVQQGKEMNCGDWIEYVLGKDTYNKLDKDRTYVYVVGYTALPSKGRRVPLNLEITSDTLTDMKLSNTPMKFFTFQSYVIYRYYKEGETIINVYPLRV